MLIDAKCTFCDADVRVDVGEATGVWRDALLKLVRCPDCARTRDAELDRQEREQAEIARAAMLRDRIAGCAIPSELRGLSWEDMDWDQRTPAIGAARRWAVGDLRGLLLTGEVGVGKTRIAATAAWAYLLESGSLSWTTSPTLFARLAAKFGSEARDAAIATLLDRRRALVLDDLDKVRPTEYGAEQVFTAIDTRIEHGLPLLVTTNLAAAELAAKWPEPFGQAIASRLVGYCEGYALTGRDRRMGKAA